MLLLPSSWWSGGQRQGRQERGEARDRWAHPSPSESIRVHPSPSEFIRVHPSDLFQGRETGFSPDTAVAAQGHALVRVIPSVRPPGPSRAISSLEMYLSLSETLGPSESSHSSVGPSHPVHPSHSIHPSHSTRPSYSTRPIVTYIIIIVIVVVIFLIVVVFFTMYHNRFPFRLQLSALLLMLHTLACLRAFSASVARRKLSRRTATTTCNRPPPPPQPRKNYC